MRTLLTLILGLCAAHAEPTKPNVLLICVDDLRPELKCFGVDYIQSPNIDRLAGTGRIFTHHYVQAPTCGASRFTLLTGRYDRQLRGNDALFARAKKLEEPPVQPSMPRFFRDHGYTTVSVGKVSHHPGGRGGANWDDDTQPEIPNAWTRHLQPTGPWKHPRGIMHGLSNGEIRVSRGTMDVLQATPGPDSIYPDGLIIDQALEEIETLAKEDAPFFLAVGIIRPHLPFGAPEKYLKLYEGMELPPIPHPAKPDGKTTWHGSGEFYGYHRWGKDPRKDAEFATEVRRHYAACVSYADAQVGRILAALDETGERENTIVVLWGDHGWHLGEHGIWGKHALFEESLRSPLIVSHPAVESAGEATDAIVETVDIFPTLCDLAKLGTPDHLDGQSLTLQLKDPQLPDDDAISYHGKRQTIRTSTHRLIAHHDGFLELYDHRTDDAETRNIAEEQPELAQNLKEQLSKALKR